MFSDLALHKNRYYYLLLLSDLMMRHQKAEKNNLRFDNLLQKYDYAIRSEAISGTTSISLSWNAVEGTRDLQVGRISLASLLVAEQLSCW